MNKLIQLVALPKKRLRSTPILRDRYGSLATRPYRIPLTTPNIYISTISQRSKEDIGFYFRDDRFGYYIVCDGHGRPGSLTEGHIAHTLVYGYKDVPPLHKLLYSRLVDGDPSDCKEIIREVYIEFDRLCFKAGTYGGSCVANVIVLNSRYVYIAHLGDCRASLWSEVDDGIIELYETRDHTTATESSRIISAGGTIIDGRIEGNLVISRAFGDWRFKVSDGCFDNITSLVISDPTVYSVDTHGEEVSAILGTDGLFCIGMSCMDYVSYIKRGKFKGNVAKCICKYISRFTSDDITALVCTGITK